MRKETMKSENPFGRLSNGKLRLFFTAAAVLFAVCLVLAAPVGAHENHDGGKWHPLTSVPADISSGTVYYYLENDVELSQTWNIIGTADVYLCLNGHDVTYTGEMGSIVYIGEGASFNLYDCVG